MTARLSIVMAGLVAGILAGVPAAWSQAAPPKAAPSPGFDARDLNGLWQGPYTPDLTKAYGKELPFTPYGLDRWKKVDTALDPTGFCLPVGPARGVQAPMPFQIVQTREVTSLLFEYQHTFRMIYTDGRKPPEDIADYPEWMGFSTGRWEGDMLIVETVAVQERTWLDTAGHEHSDKLRLTERFRRTGADTIEWTVTFDDPIFFTEPWSITRPLRRLKPTDRVMSYSCEENNRDLPHLVPKAGAK
jgi:hypothetical protein